MIMAILIHLGHFTSILPHVQTWKILNVHHLPQPKAPMPWRVHLGPAGAEGEATQAAVLFGPWCWDDPGK